MTLYGMENPFKKFFKREVKLAAAEWPPSESQTEEEIKIKIEGLRKRLEEFNKGQYWNDWTVEDRQVTQRLEEEITTLEQKLSGGETKPDETNQPEEITRKGEDPGVADRINELMKKVRG